MPTEPENTLARIKALETEETASIANSVTSVTGSAPIVSSGGLTPAISIAAATDSAAGSMSAADKTKLDAGVVIQTAVLTITAAGVAALGASDGPSPISAVSTGAVAFPANARFLGAETNVTAGAAGGVATLVMEVGYTSHLAAWVGNTTDLKTIATSGVAGNFSNYAGASIGGLTPIVTVTSTTANLSTVTTLVATVEIFYFVAP